MIEMYPPPSVRKLFRLAALIASATALGLATFYNDLAAWTVLSLAFLFSMELNEPASRLDDR